MHVRFINQSPQSLLVSEYHCQVVQANWKAIKQPEVSQLVLADTQRLGVAVKLPTRIQFHHFAKLRLEYFGLALTGSQVTRLVALTSYSDEQPEQAVQELLCRIVLLELTFPKLTIDYLYVLPQLTPKLVVEFEQKLTQLQAELSKRGKLVTLRLIMQQQSQHGIEQANSGSQSEGMKPNTVWRQLQRLVVTKIFTPQRTLSLQNMSYTKQHFGVTYPVLMTRSNFLKSRYPRQLFAEKMLVIQGKEYFVLDQWSNATYKQFNYWLKSQK